MQLRTTKLSSGSRYEGTEGNNVLKVQGLTALEYLKFTTSEASVAGALVALTGWKTAANCDSEGATTGRRPKA